MPIGPITLKLSKIQYRQLVEVFYLGKWIADEVAADELQVSNLENLEQQILACSGLKSGNEFIDYDKEEDYYTLSDEVEDRLLEEIDNYDESQFWENLVARLTMRDLHLKHTAKEIAAMSDEKGMKTLSEIQKQYFAEFEENDVDNLKLIKLRKV